MEATVHVRVKICCIQSEAEAALAVRQGADALGLVSAMPSGPGVIPEERIAAIAHVVPPPLATFLLTSEREPTRIVAQHRRCRTTTIQLCDAVAPEHYARLRAALPGVHLVQVVHVRGPEAVDEARRVASMVDALLLDSGNPALAVKELGGTGRVHDWRWSRAVREAVQVPVFLAGGLTAENARQAIAAVGPFALDVCTGVRTDGQLDARKLEGFLRAVWEDRGE